MAHFNHSLTDRTLLFSAAFVFLCMPVCSVAIAQTDLPFAGADLVTIVSDEGQDLQVGGQIQDIKGETLTLRKSGNANIELYRMSTVTSLNFSKPADWDTGLLYLEKKQHRRALEYFDKALRTERRTWAWNELQASAARVCLTIGRREEAVTRLEQVFKKDERTRHISLLPLVWDSKLPDDERLHAIPDGLNDPSVVRQLIACSALLHQPDLQPQVEETLSRIRRTSPLPRISSLAETQAWRLCLHGDGSRLPLLGHWRDVIHQLPVNSRGGPAHVLGQLQSKAHQYDNAALSLLWMPLMQPTDPALAAASMSHAIDNLNKAGRIQEARTIELGLLKRFPDTSAAKQYQRDSGLDSQHP